MPKYRVPMARDTTDYVYIVVEADSPREAEAKAWAEARNNWDLEWEVSNDSSKPYCPAYEDIELIN